MPMQVPLLHQGKEFATSPCRCPYCIKAKSLLKEVGATFTSVDLDTMPDGPAFRAGEHPAVELPAGHGGLGQG